MAQSFPTYPTVIGANVWICFYPAFRFSYFNQEPGDLQTNNSEIKGLVTGVPRLGAMLQMAFVNENINIQDYGAADSPTSWGDGTSTVNIYNHTYTQPGIYWIKKSAANGLCLAARMMKVVHRPAFGQAENNLFDRPIFEHKLPYQCYVEPATEGSVDGPFAIKWSIRLDSTFPTNEQLGYTIPRGGVAIFAERFTGQRGETQLPLEIVAGGFTADRTLTIGSDVSRVSGVAYDPIYFLNAEEMQDQQYNNKAIQALASMTQANTSFAANTGTAIPLAVDLSYLGYAPTHYLNTCSPMQAAAHIIQHVRVQVDHPVYASPTMYNVPIGSSYGSLAQFTNFLVDTGFDENAALGTYHAFSVTQGGVVSNVNQMLENQGAIFHSRSDMSMVMRLRPYYMETLPPATLDLDLQQAVNYVQISEGTPRLIYKVIIEKPVLGFTLNMSTNFTTAAKNVLEAGYQTGSTQPHYDDPSYDSSVHLSAQNQYLLVNRNTVLPAYAAEMQNDAGTLGIEDALTQSTNPTIYQFEVAGGDPQGAIVGPLSNIFTTDLASYGRGVAKEKRAHWIVSIPLGDLYKVDVGDIILITLQHYHGIRLNWQKKRFWVRNLRLHIGPNLVTKQIVCKEIDPETNALNPTNATAPVVNPISGQTEYLAPSCPVGVELKPLNPTYMECINDGVLPGEHNGFYQLKITFTMAAAPIEWALISNHLGSFPIQLYINGQRRLDTGAGSIPGETTTYVGPYDTVSRTYSGVFHFYDNDTFYPFFNPATRTINGPIQFSYDCECGVAALSRSISSLVIPAEYQGASIP